MIGMASIDETKEIIRDTPISSIISFYHSIKKKGANYQGVCPFHGDRNPSLSVNDGIGIYKCFACGAGGDAIKFVMDFSNLDFVEAVKDIGEKLGVQVEERQKKVDPRFETALKVLKVANALYRKVSKDLQPKNFTDFLAQRKLSEESVENFEIGYAPGNNALVSYLNSLPEDKKQSAIKAAKDIGLIRDNKHGSGHYDFYRDRVMFPIWDHSNKVRGFSSRAVLPNQKPKYLNSGESFIFDKGNILYGFNIAKKHIRQQDAVLIAEGQMDVVALHQYGFNYSVGTMGVALSDNSARMLSKMAKTIYLGLDSDPAGIKAMERINEMFMGQNVLPKYVDYSPAKDPDDFLKEFGRLELTERMEKAKTFLDASIERAIPVPIPETVDQKLQVLNRIFELISPLKENLMAYEKAVEASKALGLRSSNDDIIAAYKKLLKEQSSKESKHKQSFQKTAHKAAHQKPAPQKSQHQQAPELEQPPVFEDGYPGHYEDQDHEISAEEFLGGTPADLEENPSFEPAPQERLPTRSEKVTLETILTYPDCSQSEQILEILDLIDHSEVKRVIQWLRKIYLEIDESDYEHILRRKLDENFSRPVNDAIAAALFNHNKLKLQAKVAEKLLKDCKLKVQIDKLKEKKRQLAVQQKESVTEAESIEYLNKILEVEKELRDLKFNS